MIIGIDGSRAFLKERTGTENYSWEMIKALAKIDEKNEYIVYVRKGQLMSLRGDDRSEEKQIGSLSGIATGSLDFTRVSLRMTGKLRDNFNFPNFEFVEIPWPRLWTQGGLALKTWRDKLDVMWVPAHTLPVLGRWSLPMVVTVHGIEYEYLPKAYKWGANWHLTWSTRWAVKRANKVVAVSKKTKEDLVKKLGVNARKIEVVYEGVDTDKFKNRNSKVKIKEILSKYKLTRPYVLFVGTVQPRKNLIRLIEAFAMVGGSRLSVVKDRRLRTDSVQLVIAGKMGWDYKEILAMPKKLGIESRVKFLGYVPDDELAILYRGARLYVEPSLHEGFGLPVLEAMASKVPVVVANAGALPELVSVEGSSAPWSGVLVDPMSVEAMGEGMLVGWGEKGKGKKGVVLPKGLDHMRGKMLRKRLVERGEERIKDFSWEMAARRLTKVFEDVCS